MKLFEGQYCALAKLAEGGGTAHHLGLSMRTLNSLVRIGFASKSSGDTGMISRYTVAYRITDDGTRYLTGLRAG